MKKQLITLLVIAVLAGCNKKPNSTAPEKPTVMQNNADKNSQFIVSEDSIKIKDFTVEVNLSDKALQFLNEKKESLALMISFSGIPKSENQLSETLKKRIGPNGLNFPTVIREIKNVKQSNIFKVSDLSFPKEYYNSLKDNKELHINVNIMSGRRSLPDNVLNGEIMDTDFSDVLKHSAYFNLNARLIDEK